MDEWKPCEERERLFKIGWNDEAGADAYYEHVRVCGCGPNEFMAACENLLAAIRALPKPRVH